MKDYDDLFFLPLLIVLVPMALVMVIIAIPVLTIFVQIDRASAYIKLRKSLKRNNGEIFFIYADYNNFDFTNIFKTRFEEVSCVRTSHRWENDLFVRHLTKDCLSKSYPRLVKIEGNNLISKEHYSSFKHYYKRNNNIESFLELVEASVQNLKKNKIKLNQ